MIIVYGKSCIPCTAPPLLLENLEDLAAKTNTKLKYRRTAFSTKWHKEATKIWGNENYYLFVYDTDTERILTMDDIDKALKILEREDKKWRERTKKKPFWRTIKK